MSLLNAAANAAALMIPIQLILIPDDLFFQTKVYGFLALTVLVATRGSLAYGEQRAGSSTAATTSTAARTPRERAKRILLAMAAVLVLAWAMPM